MAFLYSIASAVYEGLFSNTSDLQSFKIMDIKTVLSALPPSSQKDAFLREIVYCNYTVFSGIYGKRDSRLPLTIVEKYVNKVYGKLFRSDLSILCHINVNNLNSNCLIGLNQHQSLLYRDLQRA
jgi:hypothetical protein